MAKRQATARPGILARIPAEEPIGDLVKGFIDPEGVKTIGEFLKGILAFIRGATQLELDAKAKLEAAKKLKPAKTGRQDGDLQRFVQECTAEKKKLEEQWKITAVIHGIHRRLTARRSIASDALDKAQNIANELHNDYTRAERRRVAQEQETERLRVEAAAEQRRQDDLERIETERLKAEAKLEGLSERELAFVEAITGGGHTQGDATQSAKVAGYKDWLKIGSRLLNTPKIRAAIDGKLAAIRLADQSQAVADSPLELDPEREIEADIEKVGSDVTRWKAEILDERLLIEAVLGGKHGIPSDILSVNPAKVNEYARSLKHLLNRWPGVKAVDTTKLR